MPQGGSHIVQQNSLWLYLHLFPISVRPRRSNYCPGQVLWYMDPSPSLPSVNTVLAPGLPEFIREHLNHTEPSCTKGVGREGQINWRRAGACWIIMLHVNRRLASYRFRRDLNKVEGADYWEFWRWVDWEAGRQRLFVEVGSNHVSASCPAIRGLLSSRCRRNCHRQTDLLLISISLSVHMALKREPWKVKWRGN